MSLVVVFSGPTIRPAEVAELLPEAECLPPVAQGDVYRAASRRPSLIAIIDGYFERVPAVWHKEILWAMSNGVRVMGAASMGALRAAELDVFGMQGVGRVYEMYRRGTLIDDDEVAVAHTLDAGQFRCVSEAMVNIRVTLAAAVAGGVISDETGRELSAIAKRLFYAQRSWPQIIEMAGEAGINREELTSLRAWLRGNAVDQKRLDALELIEAVRQQRTLAGSHAAPVEYVFENTYFWQRGVASWSLESVGDEDDLLNTERIMDELRLQADGSFFRAMQATLLRILALEAARREGLLAAPEETEQMKAGFCSAHHLKDEQARAEWLRLNGIDEQRFDELMQEEVLLNMVRNRYAHTIQKSLCDFLRARGIYTGLAGRARMKRDLLAASGESRVGMADVGIDASALVRWHGESIGSPSDSTAEHREKLGFADDVALLEALLREYQFRQIISAIESGRRPT